MSIEQDVDETEMNMTPMIDIVFQLIIFFLLSLKFKTVDRRIESALPKDRGLQAKQTTLDEFLKVKVKVFRRGLESVDKGDDYTMLKIDNEAREFHLPKGWKGRHVESISRIKEYDAVVAAIKVLVDRKLKEHGGDPSKVKGEIVAPPPKGGAVPHGDVMSVLNVFLELDITDVIFEGAPSPLTKREMEERGIR